MTNQSDVERAVAILTAQSEDANQVTETLDERITAMQAIMAANGLKSSSQSTASNDLEAPEPLRDLVMEMVSIISIEQRLAKQHSEAVERGKKQLAELIGAFELKDAGRTYENLTVHGAPVFTYKPSIQRVLDQAAVKKEFPDVPGNERFYTDSIRRPRLIK